MSDKKIGGEFGEVRANIDVAALSAYLLKNVKALRGPIDVKQFKVCLHFPAGSNNPDNASSSDKYVSACLAQPPC
jgi:hypothetical protein